MTADDFWGGEPVGLAEPGRATRVEGPMRAMRLGDPVGATQLEERERGGGKR